MLGAIFSSRLASELGGLGPAADRIAGSGAHLDPEQVRALPAALKPEVLTAFTHALGITFTVGAAVAAAAMVGVALLPRQLQPAAVAT